MWTIHGALCFAAEDAGAASVTGVDVMGATDRFQAEVARRDSKVRFVQGDLHEPATIAAVGPHDVVWCSGVLYHAPHPLLTLQRLRELTAGTLLLATETVAETPGRRDTLVIAPGPRGAPQRRAGARPGRGLRPVVLGHLARRRCARCSRWRASRSSRSTARRFTSRSSHADRPARPREGIFRRWAAPPSARPSPSSPRAASASSAEVAPDEFQRSIERAARQLGRNLRVAGFRKGKVPPPVVIQRLGRATVVDKAVQDGLKRWWRAALDEAEVAFVGQPKLDVTSAPADGAPLEFSIEIGVRPPAELGEYKGLEVGRREPEVEPDAVDAELQTLRERLARPEAVQRPAAAGDLLVIDFEGLIDGEPFDGGQGRDQMVELGSGMLIAGFEEQLEGATAGETRTVMIEFPDVDSPKDHRAEDVAGSRATFEVKVKEVLAKRLPELDDALAQQAAGFDTLDELREDIAAGLLAGDESRVAEEFGETVLDAVAAQATIDLPSALVAARAREIWEDTLRTLDFDGVSKDVYLQISGKTEEQALAELRPRAAPRAAPRGRRRRDRRGRGHRRQRRGAARRRAAGRIPRRARPPPQPGRPARGAAARARPRAAVAGGGADLHRGRAGARQAVAAGPRAGRARAARARAPAAGRRRPASRRSARRGERYWRPPAGGA